MITIKTLKLNETFNLSDADEELISNLCFRLESLFVKESNEVD